MLISEKTCTPTLLCPVVPPCIQVLLTECKRKSPHWPHQPLRSRSSHHQNVNTPYGSVVQFLPLCPLSNKCGSPNRNTTRAAQALFTASVSKLLMIVPSQRKTITRLFNLGQFCQHHDALTRILNARNNAQLSAHHHKTVLHFSCLFFYFTTYQFSFLFYKSIAYIFTMSLYRQKYFFNFFLLWKRER